MGDLVGDFITRPTASVVLYELASQSVLSAIIGLKFSNLSIVNTH